MCVIPSFFLHKSIKCEKYRSEERVKVKTTTKDPQENEIKSRMDSFKIKKKTGMTHCHIAVN